MDPGFTTKDPDKRCQTEKKMYLVLVQKKNGRSLIHNHLITILAIVDGI